MWTRTILQARGMLWVSVGLTAAYAIATALVFYPTPDIPSKVEWLLLAEGLFAGPMIIAGVLSVLMPSVEGRRVIAGSQAGYIILTLTTCYSTFSGEHDAQYQLALLFIPLFGYVGVVGTGIAAACLR